MNACHETAERIESYWKIIRIVVAHLKIALKASTRVLWSLKDNIETDSDSNSLTPHNNCRKKINKQEIHLSVNCQNRFVTAQRVKKETQLHK